MEARIEQIQTYKLRLAESHSVTQTAVIQQAVVDAIAIGTKAAKTVKIGDIEDILDEAAELRDEVRAVGEAIGQGIAVDDELDEAVLREYEDMVHEKELEKIEELVGAIPSPPTEIPEPEQPTRSPSTKAPVLAIPDEYL